MSISVDGYVEGPDREIDWNIVDDDFNAYAVETLKATDVLIMGRRTYELMAGYWPTAPGDDPVKEQMNGRPKLVFSRTLKRVELVEFSPGYGLHRRRGGSPEAGFRRRLALGGRKRPCSVVPRTGSAGRTAHHLDAYSAGRRQDRIRRHQEALPAQAAVDEILQVGERDLDLRAGHALTRRAHAPKLQVLAPRDALRELI